MGAPPDTGLRVAAAALAWLLGIGWQLQQPALWPPAAYAAQMAAALPLVGAWRALAARAPRAALGCLLLALALLGHGSTGCRAGIRLAEVLPAPLEGVDLQLTGVVARLPQPGAQGTRFVFDIEQATHEGRAVAVPRRASLGWYRSVDGDASLIAEAAPELRAGQRWTLSARLRQPHASLNPHGFDLELALRAGHPRQRHGAHRRGRAQPQAGRGQRPSGGACPPVDPRRDAAARRP